MLDYMIWPWMERLPAFPIVTNGLVNNPCDTFPNLVSAFQPRMSYGALFLIRS